MFQKIGAETKHFKTNSYFIYKTIPLHENTHISQIEESWKQNYENKV